MTNAARWIVRAAAVVVGVVVYGVWRRLDLDLQLGTWSSFLRGATVFGGVAWTWSATRSKPQAAAAAAGLRSCPYCAEPIRPAAVVCRYCSREVDPIPVGQPTEQAGASPRDATRDLRSSPKRPSWAVISLAVIAAMAAGWGWLVLSTSRPRPDAVGTGLSRETPSLETNHYEQRALTADEVSRLEVGRWQLADGFLFADVFNRNDQLDVTEVTIQVAGKTLPIPTLLFAGKRGTIDYETGPAISDGSTWTIVGARGNRNFVGGP